MRNILKIGWVALMLVVGVTAAVPANAQISAELAKKCRALMIKANPVEVYGRPAALPRNELISGVRSPAGQHAPSRAEASGPRGSMRAALPRGLLAMLLPQPH